MTLTQKYRTDLLVLVDSFKLVFGKSDSSVSRGAFPTDTEFVARLRRGKNVTLFKAGKLEDYIGREVDKIKRQSLSWPRADVLSQEAEASGAAKGEQASSGRPEDGWPFSEGDGA